MGSFISVVSNKRGVAIVAVTMVLAVVVLLGGAVVSQTHQDTQLSNRSFEDKRTVYMAESAKEEGYQKILDDPTFTQLGIPGWSSGTLPGGSYSLMASTIQEDPKIVVLTANAFSDFGDSRELHVTAEVIEENVSVWNNAIFGGGGQSGGVINGNAAIHGSVHLLGENVNAGNNSISALDMSGSSLIHNNYIGIPPALLAKLPALPTTNFGGEEIGTIDAKLRVKNGSVGVSGSSEIGEVNIVGNGIKETMDGIYIETDSAETRWTGNQTTDGVPNPGSVQSDNNTNALYDLGDTVQMPELEAPYEDPMTGMIYGSYGDYFSDNSLHLPTITFDDSTDALLEIQSNQADLEADGATVTIDLGAGTFTVSKNGNTISYALAPGNNAVLSISGMITIDGDLVIGEKNLDIAYQGKGTIYASSSGDGPGDIDIHSDLLPVGQFPTTGVLGLIATHDINLATGPGDSQLTMAGAFFAGGQITSRKQNQIAGTFVCNYFDMGQNVPKIYQVPALADNLPPGMIASEPIMVVTGFDERSWQIEDSMTTFNYGYQYAYPEYPNGEPTGYGY